MGSGRRTEAEEESGSGSREGRIAQESLIPNRIVRSQLKSKRRRQERREKGARRRNRQKADERALENGEVPEIKKPITIESARVYDGETGPSLTPEQAASISDEFSSVLAGETRPSIVITTAAAKPTNASYDFVKALLPVLPNSVFYERFQSTVKEFSKKASEKGHSDVLIVKEDKKKLTSLIHVHLPEGPTAIYKLSSFIPAAKIHLHGRVTSHTPEVILNNFTTALGLRVGRMLGSLFPHTPNFVGRQVATFHNQRDFIFFRFHRYVFAQSRDKARLQELGPRFTLKLRALQKGIFEHPDTAECEFKWTTKTDINRRRFFL